MNNNSGPNWLGLLKWSLGHSDGTSISEASSMSEEDKVWLEQVMQELVKDEPARMKVIMIELLTCLENENETINEDRIIDILEELRDIIDQIDMAQTFNKFGGVQCLIQLIESDKIPANLKATAISVLGTIAQNNLVVQEDIFKQGYLDRLAIICSNNNTDDVLSSKVNYSI
jgi:hsp70-interacting protein